MRIGLIRYASLISLLILAGADHDNDVDGTSVGELFQYPIRGQPESLVISRGEDINLRDFRFWKDAGPRDASNASAYDRTKHVYRINADLRAAGHQPVELASLIRYEDAPDLDRGVTIFDVVEDSGSFVVALGEGDRILIWRIGVYSEYHSVKLQVQRQFVLAGSRRGAWSSGGTGGVVV